MPKKLRCDCCEWHFRHLDALRRERYNAATGHVERRATYCPACVADGKAAAHWHGWGYRESLRRALSRVA